MVETSHVYTLRRCLCRGVARIFGLGGQTVPCRAEPDPASTEVVKSMRGVWVLPHKKFADPNA